MAGLRQLAISERSRDEGADGARLDRSEQHLIELQIFQRFSVSDVVYDTICESEMIELLIFRC